MQKLFNIFSFIIFCLFSSSISFSFPSALTLPNGNIFVIDELGIYIYDSTFNLIRLEYSFPEEDKIKSEENLSRVILKRSKGYILSLINYKIYIFNSEGQKLCISSKFTEKNPQHLTLAPIILTSSYFYFIIGFFDSSPKLYLKFFKYDLSNRIFTNFETKEESTYKLNSYYYSFLNKGLACEYIVDIYYSNNYFSLVCFFVISYQNNPRLIEGYYDITDNFLINNNYNYGVDYKDISNIKFLKSESNNNLRRTLLCYVQEDNKACCFQFYLNKEKGSFYNKVSFKKPCRNKLYGMKVTYLFEKEEVVFSCSSSDGSIQVAIFDKDLITPEFTYKQFISCESIYGFSIIYTSDYYIMSDVECNGNTQPYKKLVNNNEDNIKEEETEEEKEEKKEKVEEKETEEEKEAEEEK